jgi:hypothetical protein
MPIFNPKEADAAVGGTANIGDKSGEADGRAD